MVSLFPFPPYSYVDDASDPTEAYPFNPNGSPDGIAALSSADGRHLAMMPHPERAFLSWQQPWMPSEWSESEVRLHHATRLHVYTTTRLHCSYSVLLCMNSLFFFNSLYVFKAVEGRKRVY